MGLIVGKYGTLFAFSAASKDFHGTITPYFAEGEACSTCNSVESYVVQYGEYIILKFILQLSAADA